MPGPYSNVPALLSYSDAGADTYTDLSTLKILTPDINDAPLGNFETGNNLDVERGHLMTLTAEGADYDDFAALLAKMVAIQQVDWQVTYEDGGVGVLGPTLINVSPMFADLPFLEVFTGDATAAGNPTTTPLDWDSRGIPHGETSPEITGRADGTDRLQRPYWGKGQFHLLHELFLPTATYSELETLEHADPSAYIKVALLTEVGDYIIYNKVLPRVSRDRALGDGTTQRVRLRVEGTDHTLANLITVPATVERFFARWRVEATAGTTGPGSVVWTYTPPA